MKIGLIGLGKMGSNLALNLRDHGEHVIGFDVSEESRKQMEAEKIETVTSLEELLSKTETPRVMWLMLPSGKPTEETIQYFSDNLNSGDILIDAGNSRYTESLKHAELLNEKGIKFLDCGTSGGTSGARNGACMMICGDKEAFDYLESTFKNVAIE